VFNYSCGGPEIGGKNCGIFTIIFETQNICIEHFSERSGIIAVN